MTGSQTECVKIDGPFRTVDELELATLSWVHWCNTERIHSSIDDLAPVELEQLDYALTEPVDRVG